MTILKNIVLALIVISFAACKNQNNKLKDGPRSPGPNGPLSASDFNRDGTVTKAEMNEFIAMGPERKVGLVAYFDQFDTDENGTLSSAELAQVTPSFAFDGTDANGDGSVSKNEVEDYVKDRLYRQMGLDEFFDLIDANHDGEVSPSEMAAAHKNGQLPQE
ncbi:EF-hand domain-containing protein [Cellulophaga sp. L1A9]|uniref:EF-hand domain-containing protein n=1 Tax=Cellulophaga sp. L1A9 TaxID=2686362 RepID=UPI00131E880F|nr:EF-hand domain-containing protein [Cellulophaga sp. L1A9]